MPQQKGSFTLAKQLARAVVKNSPSVWCLSCLSLQLGVRQKDARDASQLLVLREEFFIAERVCRICGHTDDMLVSRKAA